MGRRRSNQGHGGGDHGEDQGGEWKRRRRLRREEAALESLIDSELQIEKVIMWASEEEFELRRRFCKYSAMAIATRPPPPSRAAARPQPPCVVVLSL